jgi:hypothetical protein
MKKRAFVTAAAALLAAPLLAAPVLDQDAGRFFDTFSTGDAVPGPSLSSASGVAVGGSAGDGYLTLAKQTPAPVTVRILQTTWTGGPGAATSTDLGGTTGFTAETANVLWENVFGELLVPALVVSQDGLSPRKNPVSPLRSAETVEDYYGYDGGASRAPYPAASTIMLSTGETAVVVQNNMKNLERPKIRILTTPDGKAVDKPYELDLSAHPEFAIQSVQ